MASVISAQIPSSSQTMVGDPQHQPITDLHSSSSSALTSTLSGSPHTFLQPPPSLYTAALVLAKRYLDPLASSVSQAQADRQQALRRKRKRSENGYDATASLKVNQIYLDGFSTEQVWEQARRILDASRQEVERNIERLPQVAQLDSVPEDEAIGSDEKRKGLKMVRFDDEGFEVGDSDEDGTGSSLGSGSEAEEFNEDGLDDLDEDDIEEGDGVEVEGDDYEDMEGLGEDDFDEDVGDDEELSDTFKPDPNGLNDGFFSIDDFNKQTGFLEQQDAVGDPNDGAASDEEEIDWTANPMTMATQADPQSEKRRRGRTDEDEDEDDEEDGPTFGNADLNAPEGDSEEDMDADEMLDDGMAAGNGIDNTNEVYYQDFYAPPPRKVGKKGRPSKHTRELIANKAQKGEPKEDDMQRTIDAVRRDIFEDELSAGDDVSDEGAQLDPSDPKSRRSTHERRQAKIAEEIRKLEAANVSKRKWTLSGEARASDRPLNSLLEEDLDFERTGKPVPVITAAVSEDIEEMIKRRILAKEFDEVVRRRPDSADAKSAIRRGRRPEVDDSKNQQSLAELYEAEHLARVDPEGHADKRDEKIQKEHAEIEALWADVSAKLDALSSWHYRPPPPKPSVNIVADVPTIAMEDARPTGAAGATDMGGASSMLAPHEIYASGKDTEGGEVVVPRKTGVPVAREEMSREEKLRRRRREKERLKKRLGGKVVPLHGGEKGAEKGKGARERDEVMGALKKGGVGVIGKKGEVRDVEGKNVREKRGPVGGGGYKL
ncbi:MAG: transport protein particle 22 kDa subunit [Chaenotheca gracillima]|nr:MAG: transport protein particle 22 kDa subunit [Chaenotheca gracillima]